MILENGLAGADSLYFKYCAVSVNYPVYYSPEPVDSIVIQTMNGKPMLST